MGLDEQGRFSLGVSLFSGSGQMGGQSTSQDESSGNLRNKVITLRANSFFEASRNLIRLIKRRLVYTHTDAWIFGKRLSRSDKFLPVLTVLQRDQIMRPRSYMFITKEPPTNILEAMPIYDELVPAELFTASKNFKFSTMFLPVRVEDFFDRIEGPLRTAVLPIITLHEEEKQTLAELLGTAIINKDKMVGELNQKETFGFLWLIDELQNGIITIQDEHSKGEISAKLQGGKTAITPILKDGKLRADITIHTDAIISDYPSEVTMTKERIKDLEREVSAEINKNVKHTLVKLQKEYKTDATNIGKLTYRKFPKEWHRVKDHWNKVFTNAEISVTVHTTIINTGMSEEVERA